MNCFTEVYLIRNIEWTSKLKTSHTWGKHHLENPFKCIETKQQQLRINSIEEFTSKSDTKKIKYYQILKKYSNLAANYLAMITQFP